MYIVIKTAMAMMFRKIMDWTYKYLLEIIDLTNTNLLLLKLQLLKYTCGKQFFETSCRATPCIILYMYFFKNNELKATVSFH